MDHNSTKQNKIDKDRKTKTIQDKTRNNKDVGGWYKILQEKIQKFRICF